MTREDQERFPAATVALRGGTEAVIRPLAESDAVALGDFYEQVPDADHRFYCPHPLDREHARRNAERALSPLEVVLVLELPDGAIGGYAWYRWKAATAASSGFGICISRRAQGLGVGGLLMTRLAEIARHVGPPVMQLTVQKANARAFALYSKMGFRVVREQTRRATPERGWPEEPEYAMERAVR